MNITTISFDDILPVWQNHLWPNGGHYKPMSSMTLDGGCDMSIYHKYSPTFIGIYHENELVGVNSGHKTKDHEYRSRGLWVAESMRGQKLGKQLLHATIEKAREEGCEKVWSYPRRDSRFVYYSVGFKRITDWIASDSGVENAFVEIVF